MFIEKYRQLVDELIAKTEEGRFGWKETAEPGSFQVSFPHYSVILSANRKTVRNQPVSILATSSIYSVNILNSEGKVVDSFSHDDLGGDYEERMDNLYQNARRQALAADKALDEILTELKRPARPGGVR